MFSQMTALNRTLLNFMRRNTPLPIFGECPNDFDVYEVVFFREAKCVPVMSVLENVSDGEGCRYTTVEYGVRWW